MANAFRSDIPPAPNPDSTNALSSGTVPMAMPQNALAAGAAPQQPQQKLGAPPTHTQTVAALRHFDGIRKELALILKDPSLGKSNLKSQIIDGVTRLVAGHFMKPAQSVDVLTTVPSEPLLQMKWARQMYEQATNAERAILMHHAIGFAGGGPEPTPTADDHMDQIGTLMQNRGQA